MRAGQALRGLTSWGATGVPQAFSENPSGFSPRGVSKTSRALEVEQRARYFSHSRPRTMYEAACAHVRGPIGYRSAAATDRVGVHSRSRRAEHRHATRRPA